MCWISPKYWRIVIDKFSEEYLSGRTPNPCVICNREIKWAELIRKAEALGADFIATGHYAKVRFDLAKQICAFARKRSAKANRTRCGINATFAFKTLFPLAELTNQRRAIGKHRLKLRERVTKSVLYQIIITSVFERAIHKFRRRCVAENSFEEKK